MLFFSGSVWSLFIRNYDKSSELSHKEFIVSKTQKVLRNCIRHYKL